MHIEFTIGWGFVEFTCHAVAALLYFMSGLWANDAFQDLGGEVAGFFSFTLAIILTIIGAHL